MTAWTQHLTGLQEPPGAQSKRRINRSTAIDGTVRESPDELLQEARRHDPTITLDELTGARLAASEYDSGTFTELAAIVDSELNRAVHRGKSLFQSLTYQGTFGSQGRYRVASTARDPSMRHLLAARAVLSGQARGISQGSIRFFDPESMDRLNSKYKEWTANGRRGKPPKPIVSCDALGALEAWSFDYGDDPVTGNRCPPNRARAGKHTLAWVGPITGVNPLRLMLMKPLRTSEEHHQRYEAAKALLQKALKSS